MRVDTGTVVAALAAATFIFMVIGLAAQWRVSKNTAVQAQYRAIAKGWEDKSRMQDAQIADLQEASRAKEMRVAELEGKVAILSDTLTGKASWDVLEGRIAEALKLAGETRAEIRELHKASQGNQAQILGLLRDRGRP